MSIKETAKNVATSRVGQIGIAFVVGAIAVWFFLPERIVVKKEEVVVEKEKIVEKEVVKYVDRVVEKEIIKEVQIKKAWSKTTYPDGKIVETEVYEENSQQVDRMKELEKQFYQEKLAEATKEFEKKESYYKSITNQKHFSIAAGVGTHVDTFKDKYCYGQFTYDVWGPFLITGQVTSEKQTGLGIGIRF